MGRNSRRNKAITKMYLPRLKEYCEKLEKELEALKTDPQTTLGQVINQARELYTQNSRLSVLCAAMLDAGGNKVKIKKSAMDRFENHRVLIKWELPEGVEKPEDTDEFVFMYSAEKNDQPQQPIQVGPMSHAAAIEGTEGLKIEEEDNVSCGDACSEHPDGCPEGSHTLGQLDSELVMTPEETVIEEGFVDE